MRHGSHWGVLVVAGACVLVSCLDGSVKSTGKPTEAASSGGGVTPSGGAGGRAGNAGQGGGAGGQGGDGAGGDLGTNECLQIPPPCDKNATCTDLPTGYLCTCKDGYSGDGVTCQNIDECRAHTAKCDPIATCADTPGSYTCTCPVGYTDPNQDGSKCVPSPTLGENCATPFTINPSALPGTITGDTSHATADISYPAGACAGVPTSGGAASNDHVYSLTPTITGDYVFNLTSAGFDASLYVVTSCGDIADSCVAAANTACTDCTESLTAHLAAGTTYYIVVDGSSDTSNDAGPYSLEILRPKDADHPIGFYVQSALIHDVVLNNGTGMLDPTQDKVDNWSCYITQSVALTFSPVGAGLPDDGFFAKNADHPDLQLHWNNADNGTNARVMTFNDTFTFPVPKTTYTNVQFFGTSTMENAPVDFLFTYADGTSDAHRVTIPDWFHEELPANGFMIINGLDRVGDGNYEPVHDPAIFGWNLAPDPNKTLVSISVTKPNPGPSAPLTFFVFFGAIGW